MLLKALVPAALALAFALPAAAQTTMKLSTATLNEDQHEWMKRFKDRMDKRVGEQKLKIELYPASQLGTIPRQIEGVQLGTVEGWVGPPGFLIGLEQRYQVLDAPGIFKSREHVNHTVWDPEFRKELLALGADKGIVGVSIFVASQTVFSSRRPITKLDDFKGLKIRVLATPIEREALSRIGASAVPMDLSETLPALQQGALDAVKSSITVFVTFKYYDVAKYLADTREAIIPTISVVSKVWFDKLPADIQTAILEEAKATEASMLEFSNQFHANMFKTWVERGGEINKLSEADQAELIKRMSTVGDEAVRDRPAVKAFYEKMLAAAKRAG
jgi:TRAP-type C4-dicarboxylate transport system substrate-binding protein